MLTRSFMPAGDQSKMLAYTPMFHARLFASDKKYRREHFEALGATNEPHLDGNPKFDRPLFVQFCANDPEHLLAAARLASAHCDAVDLNLGCPQGIARKGNYGAFLQESQELVFNLINKLHKELDIPITVKIRILETKEETLAYAKNVLKAGASILTVHGRRREQKGHITGVADWEMIRFLRDSLPPETVLFANGNVLQDGDLQRCLEATGADGVMSAEGNLSDPALFAVAPAVGEEEREYWRGKDGTGGWRVDAVMRRYLDILHKYVSGVEPPTRRPLFVVGDDTAWLTEDQDAATDGPPRKKQRTAGRKPDTSPNMSATLPHLFHLLRHFITKHTDVRDMLARARRNGIPGFEEVLDAVERRCAQGMIEYEETEGRSFEEELEKLGEQKVKNGDKEIPPAESSIETVRLCKRPWWVAQPIVRPMPAEAMAKGAIRMTKKEIKAQGGKDGKAVNGEAVKHKATPKEKEVVKAKAQEAEKVADEVKTRDDLVAG